MKSQRDGVPRAFLKPAMIFVAGVAAFALLLQGAEKLLAGDGAGAATAVEVEGPMERVSADQVVDVVRPLLEQPFGSLDLDSIRVEVEQLPWVARARVEREWPVSMRVRVWERTAVARWGDKSLLDSEGHAFTPAPEEIPADLPRLRAPAGHEIEVLAAFSRLRSELQGSSFEPLSLNLDARGEWSAVGAQGIELRLGREAPYERAALIRGAVSRALETSFAQVRYVDLRYTNGFAVGWITPPAAEGGKGNG